jgi:imidazole glycerol phosphate synthase glutamine amidotransferase subunit
VINYGAGNLGSVMNALKRLSIPARFAAGPDELSLNSSPFEKIIFPGDGHFATAMASLAKSGYAQAIKEWIQADKPFLGICIGLQLLFESSEEAPPVDGRSVAGLSVIPGTVRRFPGRKVPQIGWNQTSVKPDSALFRGIRDNSFFYYIHSYYADPADGSACAAEAEYYLRYCSAVERGALAAVQFHPEKSGAAGLALLQNWAGRV